MSKQNQHCAFAPTLAPLPRAQRRMRRARVRADAEPTSTAPRTSSASLITVAPLTTTATHTTPSPQSTTAPSVIPKWTPPSWLPSYLKSRKAEVDEALDKAMSQGEDTSRASRLVDAMRYSLLAGGKRVRPILVLATYDLFSDSTEGRKHAIAAGVAVEMIHTMSLIHDDLPCMDDDDYRRGRPTCHKVFGEDIAVLAGDALLARAFEVVATSGAASQHAVRVLALLGEAVGAKGLAGGQVADVEAEGDESVGLDTLRWIHTHKTAVLLRVSCAAGAILAGATDEQVEAVSTFANRIGLAFQIADDVLDVTASSAELGKTAGKDAAVDKATFPKLMGLERSRAAAAELVDEARSLLTPYGERSDTLLALADFIIKRSN